ARSGFESNASRRERRAEIVARIQEIMLEKPRDEWLKILAATRVPAGPINRIDEVASDAELQRRGMFFALVDGSGRSVPQIGLGVQLDGEMSAPRALPPLLGEHTEELLGKARQGKWRETAHRQSKERVGKA